MTGAMVMFSFFLISLQIDLRHENKDIEQTTRRRGKALKAKAAAPTHNSPRGEARALDAKPSTQSPHMLLWPAVKPWYGSNLQRTPHPNHQALTLPPAPSLSLHASLSFSVLMTRHKLPHIQPPESEDNHIIADDRDINQTP